jgi:hypothetical protein
MTVDDYRSGMATDVLATLDALREIVIAADDELTESIKWNAPSFAKGGVDRITLGTGASRWGSARPASWRCSPRCNGVHLRRPRRPGEVASA